MGVFPLIRLKSGLYWVVAFHEFHKNECFHSRNGAFLTLCGQECDPEKSLDSGHEVSSGYSMISHHYLCYVIPVLLHRRPMNKIPGPASRLRRVHGRGVKSPHASPSRHLPGLLLLRHNQEDQGNMLNNCSVFSLSSKAIGDVDPNVPSAVMTGRIVLPGSVRGIFHTGRYFWLSFSPQQPVFSSSRRCLVSIFALTPGSLIRSSLNRKVVSAGFQKMSGYIFHPQP